MGVGRIPGDVAAEVDGEKAHLTSWWREKWEEEKVGNPVTG